MTGKSYPMSSEGYQVKDLEFMKEIGIQDFNTSRG
jgi:hypothetical protein